MRPMAAREASAGNGVTALSRLQRASKVLVHLPVPEDRCGVSAPRAIWRIGLSLARRRWLRLAVVLVDVGGASVQADLRTPLGLSLYRYGFCSAEVRVCSELLRPGDVFVDGGANIGLFTLRGAAMVGSSGHVVACEPGPGTMRLLVANTELARHGSATIDLREVALSDSDGSAHFTVYEEGSGLASFAPQAGGGRVVEVTTATLDSLTLRFGDRVALVKLDIEGAEAKALQGASGLISRAAPVFLIEVEPAHLARQGSSVEDLMDALRPYGYEAYGITPKASLTKLEGSWQPLDPSNPNVVLASPRRLARVHNLIA